MKKNLSIIIVTWNTCDITKKCIETINEHLNRKIPYEIILVDNNSSDNSSVVLPKLENVTYFKNDDNLGFSKGNNIGFSHSTSDTILFLNSDMELIDDSLIKMLDFLNHHSQIGIIGPQMLNIDLTPQASVFPPQTLSNAFREFWLSKNAYSKYLPDTQEPVPVWAVSGGAVLIKKKLFEKVGKWDEKYFMFFEDLELCRSVRKIGKSIFYFPLCRVVHHHGASGRKVANADNQWKRLIPGSIMFHGYLYHHLLNSIIWSGQKWQKIKERLF